jgi:hypothetical protein
LSSTSLPVVLLMAMIAGAFGDGMLRGFRPVRSSADENQVAEYHW